MTHKLKRQARREGVKRRCVGEILNTGDSAKQAELKHPTNQDLLFHRLSKSCDQQSKEQPGKRGTCLSPGSHVSEDTSSLWSHGDISYSCPTKPRSSSITFPGQEPVL